MAHPSRCCSHVPRRSVAQSYQICAHRLLAGEFDTDQQVDLVISSRADAGII